jgi:hypothetical protein
MWVVHTRTANGVLYLIRGNSTTMLNHICTYYEWGELGGNVISLISFITFVQKWCSSLSGFEAARPGPSWADQGVRPTTHPWWEASLQHKATVTSIFAHIQIPHITELSTNTELPALTKSIFFRRLPKALRFKVWEFVVYESRATIYVPSRIMFEASQDLLSTCLTGSWIGSVCKICHKCPPNGSHCP